VSKRAGVSRAVAVVAFGVIAGCTSSDQRQSSPAKDTGTGPGQFVLASVGGQAVPSRARAKASCSETPFASWYLLESTSWKSADSVFVGCGERGRESSAIAVNGAGTFVLRGDTINFVVPDSTVGQRGLVGRGLLRGDTLTIWASDLDGGDYLYLRRAAPAK
jgi:hypothetical protein